MQSQTYRHDVRKEELRSPTSLPGYGTATLQNGNYGDEANYHIHPILMGCSFQLSFATSLMELGNDIRVFLATSVADLQAARSSSDLKGIASAAYADDGSIIGNCRYVADGKVVFLGLTEKPSRKSADSHASTRYILRPDINFQDIKKLTEKDMPYNSYRPTLDELTALSLLLSQRRLNGSSTHVPHLARYQAWIDEQVELSAKLDCNRIGTAELSTMVDSRVSPLVSTPV
jgi:hypothetical protein